MKDRTNAMRVGFVGLGVMGLAMLKNLAERAITNAARLAAEAETGPLDCLAPGPRSSTWARPTRWRPPGRRRQLAQALDLVSRRRAKILIRLFILPQDRRHDAGR